MKAAIVGAGPGGLYFARLLKKARPSAEVVVFDQSPEGATWGFGVALGGRSMKEIEATDPEVHAQLTAAMLFDNRQRIHLCGDERDIEFSAGHGAIERLRLLDILLHAARAVGVKALYDTRIDRSEDLSGYDLIVGADGVNSTLRREHEPMFCTRVEQLTNHFAWYGVGHALEPSALVFRNVSGGRFIGHYYAYSESMSTFVAECDDATWRAAGMAEMTDDQRRSLFEHEFARELGGAPLLENRSIWRQFPAVTNANWFVGNLVLIGDALRSAHFSIGSGTRLAMEDAAALAAAVRTVDGDVARALPEFVRSRQPSRDLFGEAAERSFRWYEKIAERMNQPLNDFIYDFLTRTGRIDEARLAQYTPQFFEVWQEHKRTIATA